MSKDNEIPKRNLIFSAHARKRMRERNIKPLLVFMAMQYGKRFRPDGDGVFVVAMTNKIAKKALHYCHHELLRCFSDHAKYEELKRAKEMIQKARGLICVVGRDGQFLLTAYWGRGDAPYKK